MTQVADGIETYLENLSTEKQRAWNEANEITQRCISEGNRAKTAEEHEKWERIAGAGGAIDQLNEQMRSMVDAKRREAEHDAAREAWEPIVRPGTDGEDRGSEMDPFEAWVRGQHPDTRHSFASGITLPAESMRVVQNERIAIRSGLRGAELIAAVNRGLSQRTNLNVGTAGQGKNLVPTDFLRRLYDYLEAASGIRKTNATILPTSGGEPIQLPTVTAHGTAAIVGEGTALAAADAAFGQVTLGAYKYGQLAQITNELLQDTDVDVLGFLARDLGRALGRVTGTAYVRGAGTNAPHGVGIRCATATGTFQTGATGVPSYGNLVDCVYSVIEEYRTNGATWVMKDSFEGTLRKITDTQGRPLWQPVVMAGEPDMLLGYPVIDDRNMDAAGTAAGTPVFFGDFEPFYIRDAGPIRIERSDEFAFSTDIVTYRAIMRTDSDLIDLTSGNPVVKMIAPTT